MWSTEFSIKTKATKDSVWRLWADVGKWSKWDDSVEASKIDGDFAEGATGVLKPKGGPKTKFRIVKAVEGSGFVNRSRLPLCSIDFIHEIKEIDDEIEITHRIVIKGALSAFFSKVMGRNMSRDLPRAVQNLIKMAENGR